MPHLGDHRIAVLDIKSDALVGDSLLKIVRPVARPLSCAIPAAVSAYNKNLITHMHWHNVLPRLHHLYATWDQKFTPQQQQQLKSLDRIRAEGMLFAEQRCRKLLTWLSFICTPLESIPQMYTHSYPVYSLLLFCFACCV
jgi:hypothetical protein